MQNLLPPKTKRSKRRTSIDSPKIKQRKGGKKYQNNLPNEWQNSEKRANIQRERLNSCPEGTAVKSFAEKKRRRNKRPRGVWHNYEGLVSSCFSILLDASLVKSRNRRQGSATSPYERLNPSPLFSSFLLLALLFRLSARGEPRGMKIAPRLDARIHRAALESLLRSSFDLFLFRLVARDATQRRKSRGTDADPRYSGHEPLTTLARSKCASGTYAGIRATYWARHLSRRWI